MLASDSLASLCFLLLDLFRSDDFFGPDLRFWSQQAVIPAVLRVRQNQVHYCDTVSDVCR